ncbi:MAG: hypothetical protein CHACPFDD_03356 [Phycisphaerae bacterium]|nr:hypothetical protein [Phycisphaerae bacterium]
MDRMFRRYGPYAAVGATAIACLFALAFRSDIRARLWAAQLRDCDDPQRKAALLTALCNAGPAARWGISSLLRDDRPDVRALGVIGLHHQRSPWSRQALLERLEDESEDVRELAALGLAIHRDPAVIPALEALFRRAAPAGAESAALALERLALPESVAAIQRLDDRALEPGRRAELLDALRGIGSPQCAALLVGMLADDRIVAAPTRGERMASRMLAHPAAAPLHAASRPADAPPAARTIAQRAADALAQITGVQPAFSSTRPAADRAGAADVWRAWLADSAASRPSKPGGE